MKVFVLLFKTLLFDTDLHTFQVENQKINVFVCLGLTANQHITGHTVRCQTL
jgi:hypothetical protein